MKALALAFVLLFATASCAAVFAALPTIVAATETVGQVVDAIEAFVASHNQNTPAIADAIRRARAALLAVKSAAHGAADVKDKDFQAALAEAQAAYEAIVALTGGLGVHPNAARGKLAAVGPNQLDVPTPLQVRAQLEGK